PPAETVARVLTTLADLAAPAAGALDAVKVVRTAEVFGASAELAGGRQALAADAGGAPVAAVVGRVAAVARGHGLAAHTARPQLLLAVVGVIDELADVALALG